MFPFVGAKLNVPSAGEIEGAVSMYGPYRKGSASNGYGIGGYDLKSNADSAFGFDYDHSGRQDHLVVYRPGIGTIFILQNKPFNSFNPIFGSFTGLGTFDLRLPIDRGFAFDFDHSGKLDHIVFFRAGNRIVIIKRNQGSICTPVFTSGRGIGNLDFRSPDDRCFAYDFNQTGRQDHIFCYRAGQGIVSIMQHNLNDSFESVFTSTGGIAVHFTREFFSGGGLPGCDLRDARDGFLPLDYIGPGKATDLM